MINPLLVDKTINKLTTEEMDTAIDMLSDIDLLDFRTRFNICELVSGENIYEVNMKDLTGIDVESYFGKRNNRQLTKIGYIQKDNTEIILKLQSDQILAKRIGTVENYHCYMASSVFAGIIGDIISQMPTIIKKSDKTFYITYSLSSSTYGSKDEFHKSYISYYEEV